MDVIHNVGSMVDMWSVRLDVFHENIHWISFTRMMSRLRSVSDSGIRWDAYYEGLRMKARTGPTPMEGFALTRPPSGLTHCAEEQDSGSLLRVKGLSGVTPAFF